ncbi:hypothetical protein HCN44_008484 [Aphidius gifuensis]|uniref:Uncharacterized protein n=1 Tax=Aphidius gifuensis TaxID=684658 RepID=A0A835CR48_APHGI|nr:homeobox protein 4-like [Aphidius gifuensis]KAF7989810.1 hypothetical protein HCN44_008484 [Aphidius gifuensis]
MEPPDSIPVASPDMFDSDDDYAKNKSPIKASPKKLTQQLSKDEMIIKSDIYLMKKMNESLGGIPPPPKYTICQRNCADLLSKIKENSKFFYTIDPSSLLKNSSSQNCFKKTMINSQINQDDNLGTFQTVINETQLKNLSWPLAYKEKAFGIHYNRNKYVEYIENQSVRLSDRYIGNDTQSSFVTSLTSNSNVQKKTSVSKRGVGQSPGKRLSHLAKRRRVFSIANLQKMNDKPHCLISVKKTVMKKATSPRKINKSSPKILAAKLSTRRWSVQSQNSGSWKLKTPPCCLAHSSPIHHTRSSNKKITNNDLNNQTQRIKRSLFLTPVKIDLTIDDLNNKNNCNENNNSKLIKKLSFDCTEDSNGIPSSVSSNQSMRDAKNKSNSSTKIGAKKMDDIDRKKLVWAVSQALKSKGIDSKHVKFQYYGRQLVKKVKEIMPYLENHDIPRKPGSTTERMLAHAKKYAFLLVDDREK